MKEKEIDDSFFTGKNSAGYTGFSQAIKAKDELTIMLGISYLTAQSPEKRQELLTVKAKKGKEVKDAIYVAAEQPNLPLVQELLKLGCIPTATSSKAPTAITALVTMLDLENLAHQQWVEDNIELLMVQDKGGKNIAHWAAIQQNFGLLKLLAKSGFNVAKLSDTGKSIADYVKVSQAFKQLPKDHQHKAMEKVQEAINELLYYAVKKDQPFQWVKEIVEKYEGDVNYGSHYTLTLLQLAVCKGNIDLVKYLLTKDVKVNPISGGNTILHYAVIGGHKDMVEYLIPQSKADLNHKNNQGDTPLGMALNYKQINIVNILLPITNISEQEYWKLIKLAGGLKNLKLVTDVTRIYKQQQENPIGSDEEDEYGGVKDDEDEDEYTTLKKEPKNKVEADRQVSESKPSEKNLPIKEENHAACSSLQFTIDKNGRLQFSDEHTGSSADKNPSSIINIDGNSDTPGSRDYTMSCDARKPGDVPIVGKESDEGAD